jgi:hypothetical protein
MLLDRAVEDGVAGNARRDYAAVPFDAEAAIDQRRDLQTRTDR